jgi:hypothetical protein
MEANPLLTAFDLADVNGMKLGLFRKLFLAQASFGAVSPDGIAQNLEVGSGARHSVLAKQEGGKLNTPNMGVFFFLHFWLVWFRTTDTRSGKELAGF